MTTYQDSGVDIAAGNSASQTAYAHAQSTFGGRKGKLGKPVTEAGGYAGLLDMGDYYLVQNTDGTGSKMALATALDKYDTIGYDLLAMVADDAICLGAEVISVTNTLDVPKVEEAVVDELMKGLATACTEQQIVIPGGEIAEVPGATTEPVWNATAVGVVAKDRLIDTGQITAGDTVIALQSGVARSNGFSLIRKILQDKFGDNWVNETWRGSTWGQVMLTPSIVYHGAILNLIGRYGEEQPVTLKGLAHITGGGIAENLARTLKKSGCGAQLSSLFAPHDALKDLMELGSVSKEEAYKTWNMGNGMLVVCDPKDSQTVIDELKQQGIAAQEAGVITAEAGVKIG